MAAGRLVRDAFRGQLAAAHPLALAGAVLLTEVSLAAVLIQQQGVGPETPLTGVTLGAVLVVLLAAGGLALKAVVTGIREGWAPDHPAE